MKGLECVEVPGLGHSRYRYEVVGERTAISRLSQVVEDVAKDFGRYIVDRGHACNESKLCTACRARGGVKIFWYRAWTLTLDVKKLRASWIWIIWFRVLFVTGRQFRNRSECHQHEHLVKDYLFTFPATP